MKTSVKNSRPQKKRAQIWRRRFCDTCKESFSTIERPSLREQKILKKDGSMERFNIGVLTIDIAKNFSHNQEHGDSVAIFLAETIEEKIARISPISTQDIARITHSTLELYDTVAALQYAARHEMVTQIKKRGRPSFRYEV